MGSKYLSNEAAAGVPYYTPAQRPPAGTALDPESAPTLFKPLRIRSVELHNRFVTSPMCQYSADNGHLTDYHLVHLGQFALHGVGLVFVESTSVEPRGRITPQDSGLWTDSQIEPLKRIVNYIHSQGSKAAIQLGHAGRKASTLAPWLTNSSNKMLAPESVGGWPDDVIAPSSISFAKDYPHPKEITVQEIARLTTQFADAAVRAVKAGFDVIEIHGAHGYLISQFLSPLSNKRNDQYGGSFENRTRLLREVILATRAVIPEDMPLWIRISATEWMEWTNVPTWDINETTQLAKLLPGLGVDVLDVSSGGNNAEQRIDFHPRYQTELAAQIRTAVSADGLDLHIAALGAITEAEMARSLVQESEMMTANGTGGTERDALHGPRADMKSADLVVVARQFLREPEWVLRVADQLGVPIQWPHQYHLAPKTKGRTF